MYRNNVFFMYTWMSDAYTYTYIYVCICLCMCVCVCVFTHSYISHTNTRTHTHTHVCTQNGSLTSPRSKRMYLHTLVICIYIYKHANVSTIRIQTHEYIHITHTNTQTHARTQSGSPMSSRSHEYGREFYPVPSQNIVSRRPFCSGVCLYVLHACMYMCVYHQIDIHSLCVLRECLYIMCVCVCVHLHTCTDFQGLFVQMYTCMYVHVCTFTSIYVYCC